MSVTQILKDCIPPVILRLLKNLISYHKLYNSYNDALSSSSSSLGYEDPYLINAILQETKEYIISINDEFTTIADETLIHTLIPLAFLNSNRTLNVIDIGGASGIHYFALKKVLGEKYKFNWHIVETNSLIKISRVLENSELKFFNKLHDAVKDLENIDLILASGAIQYFEDPKKILTEIVNTGAAYILLTRLSLSQDKEIISVQRSLLSQNSFEKLPPGIKDKVIKYPHTNIREIDLNRIIQTNYKIKIKIEDKSGIQRINNHKCVGYGLLLENKFLS